MKYIVFFICCILQPICLPVPEATTILTGTVKLGANPAFFIGLVGIMIGIVFMYQITRYLSKKYLKKIKHSKNFEAYHHYMSKYPILTTGLLFTIPVTPDEIICIGSALGNIKLTIMLPIAFFSKIISIGMITYSESIAKSLSIKQCKLIVIEIILMLLASYIYQKVNEKRKEKNYLI